MTWQSVLAERRRLVGEAQTPGALGAALLDYMDMKDDPTAFMGEFLTRALSEVRESVVLIGLASSSLDDYDFDLYLVHREPYDPDAARRVQRSVMEWIPAHVFTRRWSVDDLARYTLPTFTYKAEAQQKQAGQL